jgi:hypothetical protein
VTFASFTLSADQYSEVMSAKEKLFSGDDPSYSTFKDNFDPVAEFGFDEFLYDFDPKAMGIEFEKKIVVVMVLRPNLENIYGCDAVYCAPFDRQRYRAFLEQKLANSVADKLSLVADDVIWFCLNVDWAAYGSRDHDLVLLGRKKGQIRAGEQ